MKRKRPKKTREQWAEIEARHEDSMRRLAEMIERYRLRAGDRDERTRVVWPRKSWAEMTPEERAAERARSKHLDRRLLAAIERYGGRQASA